MMLKTEDIKPVHRKSRFTLQNQYQSLDVDNSADICQHISRHMYEFQIYIFVELENMNILLCCDLMRVVYLHKP